MEAAAELPAGFGPRSRFVPAPDGLGLHVLEWRPPLEQGCPVLCLPGLARTADDFLDLGTALSHRGSRRVVAVDYRGRGQSAWDPDPTRYDIRIEAADVLAICDAAAVDRAAVIGTSRGGLIAMTLAAIRPTLLDRVVLNDIGPVIEARGLIRIKGYVGRGPLPATWAEAGGLLAASSDGRFPTLTTADWERRARLTWYDTGSGLALRYDPALASALAAFDPTKPVPQLWDLFEGLAEVPTLVIRGGNSDLLSEDTVHEMRRRLPHVETHVVADQGHAPFLDDPPTIERIATFLAPA